MWKRRNQKEIPTPKKRGEKKNDNNKVLILRKHIVSRASSYCPIGGHSVPQGSNNKKSNPKHKTNRTRTEVSPRNDQYYKTTGGFKPVLKVSPYIHLMLLFFQSSGIACNQLQSVCKLRVRLWPCKIDLSPQVILYY